MVTRKRKLLILFPGSVTYIQLPKEITKKISEITNSDINNNNNNNFKKMSIP